MDMKGGLISFPIQVSGRPLLSSAGYTEPPVPRATSCHERWCRVSLLGRQTDANSFHGACCLWLVAACQSWRPSMPGCSAVSGCCMMPAPCDFSGDPCSIAKRLNVWVACPAESQPSLHSCCFDHWSLISITPVSVACQLMNLKRRSVPLQVNNDGSIESLPNHEHFPDFPDARVLGKKVGTLPDILTT